MSDPIVLKLPEDISNRARQIAAATDQSVEQVIIDHLRMLTIPLPKLPADEQAELDALRQLSDDALRTIAREQMPEDVQTRAHELMDKNAQGKLPAGETSELEAYVLRADRLMLRKAEAAAILKERGYAMSQKDFMASDD